MVPSFIKDWQIGIDRFRSTNPHFQDFDTLGKPVFAGWVFNGFDTARTRRSPKEIEDNAPQKDKKMVRADGAMHARIASAINDDLVNSLKKNISNYEPIAINSATNHQIGDIEDANVLIQNSLLLNVPLGSLDKHQQVIDLYNRQKWAESQLEQIKLIRTKFNETADHIIKICI
jgi:hypothetical protein